MVTPATTVRIFSGYLFVLATVLILAPNALLGWFGFPVATDVWIRVVGMLVGFLGYYYVRAAASGFGAFFAWTVPARLSVLGFFGAFVALDFAPPALLLFGVIDAAAAVWTWFAIRNAGAEA